MLGLTPRGSLCVAGPIRGLEVEPCPSLPGLFAEFRIPPSRPQLPNPRLGAGTSIRRCRAKKALGAPLSPEGMSQQHQSCPKEDGATQQPGAWCRGSLRTPGAESQRGLGPPAPRNQHKADQKTLCFSSYPHSVTQTSELIAESLNVLIGKAEMQ